MVTRLPTTRRAGLAAALSLLCCCALAGPAAGGESGAPAKGQPFPGESWPVNYEDLLAHCDLALTGKVAKLADGRVELEAVEALRGEFADKSASLAFSGSWEKSGFPGPVEGRPGTFFCLRGGDGKLRLAGDPPKGGGYVAEGPDLVRKLVEAAGDPAKGYASKEAAVRLSSACRLVRAWAAAEDGRKPPLPAGLVEVLIAGLEPGPLQGRHVNSAARYALNTLLNCDLNRVARYSTNQDDETRKARAALAREIWERTVAKVRERRSGAPAPKPPVDENEARAEKLVRQLGDADFEKREAAQKEIEKLGKPALAAVERGTRDKDPEVAERCARVLEALRAAGASVPKTDPTFDLDRAEPLVPRPEPAPK